MSGSYPCTGQLLSRSDGSVIRDGRAAAGHCSGLLLVPRLHGEDTEALLVGEEGRPPATPGRYRCLLKERDSTSDSPWRCVVQRTSREREPLMRSIGCGTTAVIDLEPATIPPAPDAFLP